MFSIVALTLLGAAPPPQDVRVEVRTWSVESLAAVECWSPKRARLSRADDAPAEARVFRWAYTPGDVLSCETPGAEPIDVSLPNGATGVALVGLQPGRPVTLRSGWKDVDAVVEWRALMRDRTSLVAHRSMRISGASTLLVAGAPRVIRIRPAGMSPLSFAVPEGLPDFTIDLPAPTPGGELFGLLPPHQYRPETLELRAGNDVREIEPDTSRFFAFRGLAAPSYMLLPRYKGGLAAPARSVTVSEGKSTELIPLPLAEPGAARVQVAPEFCREGVFPGALSLHTVKGQRAVNVATVVRERLLEPPCDRYFEGLPSGRYGARLTRERGATSQASTLFTVARGRETSVILDRARVHASGRVTLGANDPASDLTLAFQSSDGSETWTTRTNADGGYSIGLGEPGSYTVSFGAAYFPMVVRRESFRAGHQEVNFALGDGALELSVIGEDGDTVAETVEISVEPQGKGTALFGFFPPSEDRKIRLVGLGPGTYSIAATTPSGLISSPRVEVTLGRSSRTATAELRLARRRAVLNLVDDAGAPVAGATILAGSLKLAEPAPGSYSLDKVAAGTPLMIRAKGYLPVCQVLKDHELPTATVTTRPATEEGQIVFENVPARGHFMNLPGSDCVLPIDFVASSDEQRQPDRAVLVPHTVVTVSLPPGLYKFRSRGKVYDLPVPGQAVHVQPKAGAAN